MSTPTGWSPEQPLRDQTVRDAGVVGSACGSKDTANTERPQ